MRGFGIAGAALLLCVGFATARRAQLSAEDIELKVTIYDQQEEMVASLESWVEHNTGSWNREGLEQMADLLAAECEGGEVPDCPIIEALFQTPS